MHACMDRRGCKKANYIYYVYYMGCIYFRLNIYYYILLLHIIACDQELVLLIDLQSYLSYDIISPYYLYCNFERNYLLVFTKPAAKNPEYDSKICLHT